MPFLVTFVSYKFFVVRNKRILIWKPFASLLWFSSVLRWLCTSYLNALFLLSHDILTYSQHVSTNKTSMNFNIITRFLNLTWTFMQHIKIWIPFAGCRNMCLKSMFSRSLLFALCESSLILFACSLCGKSGLHCYQILLKTATSFLDVPLLTGVCILFLYYPDDVETN